MNTKLSKPLTDLHGYIHKTIAEPPTKMVQVHRIKKSQHKGSFQIELTESAQRNPYVLNGILSEGNIEELKGITSNRLESQKKLPFFKINKSQSIPAVVDEHWKLQGEPLTPTPLKKKSHKRVAGSFSENCEFSAREKHSNSQLDSMSPLKARHF